VLFFGVAMSITAMPVLARILTERGMQRTSTGALAMVCAAIDDVLAWSVLAVVVAVAAGGSLGGVTRIIGLTIAFVAVAFLLLRPLLARMVRWYDRAGRLSSDMLAAVLVGLLLSAVATQAIGLDTIFGAFVFGAIMPRRGAAGLTREILERLEQVSLLLLLPIFFVVAGLQVDVGALDSAGLWQLGLILLAAIAGKFLGGMLAARARRMPKRQSTAIGLLMNTRGLTEIVILQVGVQLGILDSAAFTLMVVVALVTTAMTGPLLRLVYPDRVLERELAAADRIEAGDAQAYTVLVEVPDGRAADLGALATRIAGRQTPARVVLCRLLPSPIRLEVASGVASDLARIAEVGAELRLLARALEDDSPVSCSVIVRFSRDPGSDLAVLAETLAADVVLTGPERFGSALPRPAHTTGVRARLGAGPVHDSPVVAIADGGSGGRTALRLGAQLAAGGRGELAVACTNGRRAARQAGAAVESLRLRGLAVDCPDQDLVRSGQLLVTSSAELPDGLDERVTVLHVQPDQADRDEELEQTLARVTLHSLGQRQS